MKRYALFAYLPDRRHMVVFAADSLWEALDYAHRNCEEWAGWDVEDRHTQNLVAKDHRQKRKRTR